MTVEAEPEGLESNDENNPFGTSVSKPRRRGKTVKVPLKGGDNSPALGRRARPSTPAKKTRRSGTPVQRRRRSVTRVDSDEESEDDSRDQDFTPKPKPRKGRRKTSFSNLILGSEIDTPEQISDGTRPEKSSFGAQNDPRKNTPVVEDSERPLEQSQVDVHPEQVLSCGPDDRTEATPEVKESRLAPEQDQDHARSVFDMAEIPSPPTFSSISPNSERQSSATPVVRNTPPVTLAETLGMEKLPPSVIRSDTSGRNSSKRPSPVHDIATPPRRTGRPSFNFTKLTPLDRKPLPLESEAEENSGFSESEVLYDSVGGHEPDATLGAEDFDEEDEDIPAAECEIGEKTMLDSEGFSMVSLDSVESAKDGAAVVDISHHSIFSRSKGGSRIESTSQVPRMVSISTTASAGEEHGSQLLTPSPSGSSMANIGSGQDTPSKMRSSPPLLGLGHQQTPASSRPPLTRPPPLTDTPSSHYRVTTPVLSKVVGAGVALQGVVKSPIPRSSNARAKIVPDQEDESLFHGFSANTRRQLHEGLKLGEELARRSPCPNSTSNSNEPRAGIHYPRLPTPEQNGKASVAVSLPPTEKLHVEYPSMSPARLSQALNSARSYDEMSWKPKTPPEERPTCISPDSMEAQWQREREAVSRQIEEADASEVIVINDKEDTDDGISELDAVAEHAEEEEDLSKLEQLFSDDSNTKLRRARLSRTWRRRSSSGFAYRDEQPLGSSPRHLREKKSSSNSSTSSDGVTAFWQPGTRLDSVRPTRRTPQTSPWSEDVPPTQTFSRSTSIPFMPTPTPSLDDQATSIDTATSTTQESENTPLESPLSNESVDGEDTGLFWHRNLPSIFKEKPQRRPYRPSPDTLKSDKLDLSALLKLETTINVSPLRTPGRDFQSPAKVLHTPTTGFQTPKRDLFTPGLRSALKTTGTPGVVRATPLRSVSRVSFADVDETHEISIDESSEAGASEETGVAYDTMASDVRQLQAEMLASHLAANDGEDESDDSVAIIAENESSIIEDLSRSISQHSKSSNSVTVESMESEDSEEAEESEDPIPPTLSSLSIAPTKDYQPLFEGYSQADADIVREVVEKGYASTDPGLVSRLASYLWSYLPFTGAKITVRINHSLLADQPLLPRVEPWTKTHYKVLDSLYQAFKKSPVLFSPDHPINEYLAPVICKKQRYRLTVSGAWQSYRFADWIDVEIKNWGYTVQLSESHIVLAALYSQLLTLNSVDEYERLVGRKISTGNCNPGSDGEEIGIDKIVFRLFSVIHGEMVRADEKKGKIIDRSQGTGWYRFKGEEDWRNYM